jgi:uncharacterized protein
MSFDIAKATVDEIFENASKTKQKIAIFRYLGGGEPTIEWELLEKVTRYIRNQSKLRKTQSYIRLITNGTLLKESRMKWLSKNINFVTLSFEIMPDIQNKNRPFVGGRGSYDTLVDTVNLLIKNGIEFQLRTTISSASSPRLLEMVKHVHKAMPGVKYIRFEPMAEIGRVVENQIALEVTDTCTLPFLDNTNKPSVKNDITEPRFHDPKTIQLSEVSKPSQQEFVDSFKEAYRFGKDNGIEVTSKLFVNHRRRSTRYCNAEFVVGPEGTITGCHRYSREEHIGYKFFKIGEFDNGEIKFDIENINNIRSVDNTSFDDCQSCFAKWSCASGCLSARMSPDGISKSWPICHITRELLKFGIDEELKKEEEMALGK